MAEASPRTIEMGRRWTHQLVLKPSDERLVVAGERLRSLDVTDGDSLTELDLRGCASPIHLAVDRCPTLRRILVPTTGPGAVVHLHLGDRTPHIAVDGLVDEVDMAWLDDGDARTLRIAKPRRRSALDGAYIGPVAGRPATAEVMYIVDPDGAPPSLDLPHAVQVGIFYTPGLEEVRLGRDHRRLSLEAMGCPDLKHVHIGHHLWTGRLLRCPSLADITGQGRMLLVGEGSARVDTLTGLGPWTSVFLHRAEMRAVHIDLVHHINAAYCQRLQRVRSHADATVVVGAGTLPEVEGGGSVRVEPLSDDAIVAQVRDGDATMRRALLQWCARDGKPRKALRALEVLKALAEQGEDLTDLWETRMALYLRQTGGNELRQRTWAWSFPEDLAQRGWRADLQLWTACRLEDPAARAFEPLLWSATEPAQLEALGAVWVDNALTARERTLLGEVFLAALQHGARGGGTLPLDHPDHIPSYAEELRRLQSVLGSLARAREEAVCPKLVEAYCGWLVRRMPTEDGLNLLGALRALGSKEAGHALARIAADNERYDEVLRRVALMQVISPVRERLFAFEQGQ